MSPEGPGAWRPALGASLHRARAHVLSHFVPATAWRRRSPGWGGSLAASGAQRPAKGFAGPAWSAASFRLRPRAGAGPLRRRWPAGWARGARRRPVRGGGHGQLVAVAPRQVRADALPPLVAPHGA